MSNTTIQLKYSTETGNTPSTLEFGEIAINLSDGKLFYKNPTEEIKFIENFSGPAGLDTEIQFNNEGELGANSNFTYDKENSQLNLVSARYNSTFEITGNFLETTSTDSTVIFSFDKTVAGSGKFVIQATEGTKRQVTEILVVHDGTVAYATEYAIIRTNGNLFNIEVDIDSNNVRLKTTSSSANSTVYKVSSNLLLL
jgi:hypothetical protein